MNMLKFVGVIFMIVASLPGWASSTVVNDSVKSDEFGRAMFVRVYLPEGFDAGRSEKYPVLYLLHGRHGNETDWTVNGHLQERADQLIKSGETPEMVIVMPDAGYSRTGGADGYFDAEGYPYSTYFFNELLPAMERRYNAGGSPEKRALAGLSMGGGGAVAYAQRHPDMFRSVYAMSAAVSLPDYRKENTDPYNSAIRRNDCIDFVNAADKQTLGSLRAINWTLDCGDDDFLFDVNIDFFRAMRTAGVRVELRVRDGSHTWTYWRDALPQALTSAFR